MAKRSARLALVLQVTERAEQTAAEAFEAAQRSYIAEQQKLEELRLYHADYQSTFTNGRVMRASDIARQRAFLQKLADAITQQGQMVAQAERVIAQRKSLWHKAHLKHRAMVEHVGKVRLEEQKLLERKEEKMLDEWSAAKARRSSEPRN